MCADIHVTTVYNFKVNFFPFVDLMKWLVGVYVAVYCGNVFVRFIYCLYTTAYVHTRKSVNEADRPTISAWYAFVWFCLTLSVYNIQFKVPIYLFEETCAFSFALILTIIHTAWFLDICLGVCVCDCAVI
jgi:hypothetical protein